MLGGHGGSVSRWNNVAARGDRSSGREEENEERGELFSGYREESEGVRLVVGHREGRRVKPEKVTRWPCR
ncbi:hypothetical protein HAX54_010138 [Datura stramonium]|uniref:Uncharacterized protein n=1 Tax=Datura stramonium TaxID=4076 RepID=A0ABS8WXR5_DATST|nr:hypothetical protein [Datura stramonium]